MPIIQNKKDHENDAKKSQDQSTGLDTDLQSPSAQIWTSEAQGHSRQGSFNDGSSCKSNGSGKENLESEKSFRIVVRSELGEIEVKMRGMWEFERCVGECLSGKEIGRKVQLQVSIILLERMKKMGLETDCLQDKLIKEYINQRLQHLAPH